MEHPRFHGFAPVAILGTPLRGQEFPSSYGDERLLVDRSCKLLRQVAKVVGNDDIVS